MPFPEAAAVVNVYPIATLTGATQPALADQVRRSGHRPGRSAGAGRRRLRAGALTDDRSVSVTVTTDDPVPARSRGGRAGTGSGLPGWVFVPAALGGVFIVLPLVAMLARVQWSEFWALITSESSIAALWLSLKTSTASTVLCVLLGTPMALVLARATVPRAAAGPVPGAAAAGAAAGGRRHRADLHLRPAGPARQHPGGARVCGSRSPPPRWCIAQTFVALPFLVLSLEGSLRTAGRRYEAVAATLGASPTTVLRRVTIPLVLPGLISGAVLAFARALGEFGATLTFAGSLQGVTRTLPLEIYLQRETDADAAVALSLVLVVVAVLIVLATRGRASEGVAVTEHAESARRRRSPARWT